jgi:MFS transporter, DHA1 family, multidrug resistance protein
MPAHIVVWFTSLFLGLQPITTDLYLPALPSITQALAASMPQAQLTLSALLLCFGISQLIWGPVSDKHGRRPVLLAGLALYTLAALGSALAQSIEALIAWRALQGVAMGAPVMCARAMARDLYAPQEAARLVSKGLSGLGVIAVLSVPVGSLVSSWLGWRWSMATLGLCSALIMLFARLRFVETNQRRNALALQPAQLISTWRAILTHPQFWAYALLALTSYAGLFTFLATSSFVYLQVLGHSKAVYSVVVASVSVVYIIGTVLGRRMLARHGVQRMVWIGGWISLVAGLAYALLYLAGFRTLWALLLPQLIYMLGHGFHQPAGQAGSAAAFPQAAGAASAMAGFLMMLAAFGMGAWIGSVLGSEVWPLVAGVSFWSALLVIVAWTLVQRYGQFAKA